MLNQTAMKDIINQYKEYKKEEGDKAQDHVLDFVVELDNKQLFEVFEYLEQLHDQIEEIEQLRLKNKG